MRNIKVGYPLAIAFFAFLAPNLARSAQTDWKQSGEGEFLMMKKKASARRTRRTHNPAFKARVAVAALREDKTMTGVCEQFELHPNHITEWKRQLLERADDVFDAGARS